MNAFFSASRDENSFECVSYTASEHKRTVKKYRSNVVLVVFHTQAQVYLLREKGCSVLDFLEEQCWRFLTSKGLAVVQVLVRGDVEDRRVCLGLAEFVRDEHRSQEIANFGLAESAL